MEGGIGEVWEGDAMNDFKNIEISLKDLIMYLDIQSICIQKSCVLITSQKEVFVVFFSCMPGVVEPFWAVGRQNIQL